MRELMAQLMEDGGGRMGGEETQLRGKIQDYLWVVLTLLASLCVFSAVRGPCPPDNWHACCLLSEGHKSSTRAAPGGLGRGQGPSFLTRLHFDTTLREMRELIYSFTSVTSEGQKG